MFYINLYKFILFIYLFIFYFINLYKFILFIYLFIFYFINLYKKYVKTLSKVLFYVF